MKRETKKYMSDELEEANEDLENSILDLEEIRGVLNYWYDCEDQVTDIEYLIKDLKNIKEEIEEKLNKQWKEEQDEIEREYWNSRL